MFAQVYDIKSQRRNQPLFITFAFASLSSTTLWYYGYTTGSPPSPRRQAQSAHYRKRECRENIDFAEGLRYDRKSGGLQARSRRDSP